MVKSAYDSCGRGNDIVGISQGSYREAINRGKHCIDNMRSHQDRLVMKKILSRIVRLVFLIWLVLTTSAYAYNEGGHYYTLLALFNSLAESASEERIQEIKLEAFCAELPDLASELDAITQRTRVFMSLKDNLWGLIGSCQTTVSSHMVASQNYLHGFSGASAPQLRNAAKTVIAAIDDDLRKPGLAKEIRKNLICARGFADHLYGDSFAHVKLSSEKPGLFSGQIKSEMYATGLGHVRDGHYPDYLYGHNLNINKWPQWVEDSGVSIAAGADMKSVLEKHNGCNNNNIEICEGSAQEQLVSMLKSKPQLLVENMQSIIATGIKGIGDMERATPCDSVVESVYADVKHRPQCATVWNLYLERVVPVFYRLNIDPTSRLHAVADNSCSAWRCSGKSVYGGEAPGSCAISITDDLKFGLDPT